MKFTSNVSFYDQPFEEETMKLYELPTLCDKRLDLYKIFKVSENISCENLKSVLAENNNPLRHLLELEYNENVEKARLTDYVTHFILKILYSDTYPDFFINCECLWLKLRLNMMPHEERLKFYKANLKLIQPTDEEREELEIPKGVWYKFRFTEAKKLTVRREFPLHLGYLYIPENKLVFVAQEKLQSLLKAELKHCKKMQDSLDEQLAFVRQMIIFVKPYNVAKPDDLQLAALPAQVKYFPLCMKLQYEALQEKHHLKHFSRLQYGLFLKGLGLSFSEAEEMWRMEFTKVMTEKRFEKSYLYYIKHLYGLVGGKIDYPPQCCDSIQKDFNSADGVHGCPFKHLSQEALNNRLKKDIPHNTNARQEIMDLQKEEKYKLACTKYFVEMHSPNKNIEIIDHPITYYNEACKSCQVGGMVDIEDFFASESSNED